MFCLQMKFNVLDYDEETYSVASNTCEHCLCDNRWHTAKVVMKDTKMSINIDGHAHAEIDGPQDSLDTFYELFIGGFPGNLWSLNCSA